MSFGHFALSRANLEWGRQVRKEEDRLRGLRSRARRDWIADSLLAVDDSGDDLDALNCWDDASAS